MSYLGAVRSSAPAVSTGSLAVDTNTVDVDCAGFTTALVQFKDGGSFSGTGDETIYFEVSLDGSTWLSATYFWAFNADPWQHTGQGAVDLVGSTYPVYVLLHGAVGFRVRLETTPTAGTIAVVVGLSMVAAPPPANDVTIVGSPNALQVYATSGNPVYVTVDGNLPIQGNVGVNPSTAFPIDIALNSDSASQTLAASNVDRQGMILNNTDANIAYVYYGATASLSQFTAAIPPVAADGTPGYWEMPVPAYTGAVSVIWGANGSGAIIGAEL